MKRNLISAIILLAVVFLGYYLLSFEEAHAPTVYNDLISSNISDGETISSPLEITGEARGQWFFEANFPIVLTNWDGLIIAEGYATAQDEWMTTDFVPFTATIDFERPEYGERGTLILQKANASGLPEHDDALEIQVIFK